MNMLKNRLVLLLMILASVSGCEKNLEPGIDGNLVFGVAYGFCAGDCAHFFQIKEGALFKDKVERYAGDDLIFEDAPLSNDKYILAEPLVRDFPKYLIENPNETIGCPDCADQGGYHLILKNEGESQYWHIDTSTGSHPQEIRAYIEQLKSVLEQLQD